MRVQFGLPPGTGLDVVDLIAVCVLMRCADASVGLRGRSVLSASVIISAVCAGDMRYLAGGGERHAAEAANLLIHYAGLGMSDDDRSACFEFAREACAYYGPKIVDASAALRAVDYIKAAQET